MLWQNDINSMIQIPNFIDFLVLQVSAPPNEMNQQLRKCLLSLLRDCISNPMGLTQFNTTYLDRGRLSRLKILLRHINEQEPATEDILRLTNYKSVLFEKIKNQWKIRYTIVLDRSGSMSGANWKEAEETIEHLAERIEEVAPNGMTLWLFSDKSQKFSDLRTCEQVNEVFQKVKPNGGTNLTGVLKDVAKDHFQHGIQEHLIVITDGEPNEKESVFTTLVDISNKMQYEEELGISFFSNWKRQRRSRFFARFTR